MPLTILFYVCFSYYYILDSCDVFFYISSKICHLVQCTLLYSTKDDINLFLFLILLFFYSHVHTLFGLVLPPATYIFFKITFLRWRFTVSTNLISNLELNCLGLQTAVIEGCHHAWVLWVYPSIYLLNDINILSSHIQFSLYL
jgi:hypothetical protein